MRRIVKRKKLKLSTKLLLIIGLIIFFTYFLLSKYYTSVNPKIIEASRLKLNKMTNQFLSSNVGYGILKDVGMEEILNITQNSVGEILYVDFNLEKSYEILDLITKNLTNSINMLETGKIDLDTYDKNLKNNHNGLMLELPLFIASNDALLANLGPKIYVQVNFVGSILTNIKSKVTNYGMNNALLELYVTIKITEELISPVTKKEEKFLYDVLIAAKVINGRVPTFFGESITSQSNILESTLKN